MNKQARKREAILRQGWALQRIFNVAGSPVELYKRLHRIEAEAHRAAENYCNGYVTEEQDSKKAASVLKRLDAILNFKAQGIPVFVNGDPRGYSLKIEADYVRDHDIDIYRDWGGYGILAPDFD